MSLSYVFQATATQKVQTDLMDMLHIPKCIKFVSTVNRPNLFYMVQFLVGVCLYIAFNISVLIIYEISYCLEL